MNQITNNQTKKIIKDWFEKSQSEDDIFNQFIALWISFNAFFIAKFKNEFTNSRFPAEYEFLNKVKDDSSLKDLYQSLDKDSNFNDFLDFLENGNDDVGTHFPKKVADMRFESNESKAKEFSNIDDFSQFIDVIYKIRCNLFHGNKSDSNPADKFLVEYAYKILEPYLKEVYKKL